MTLRTFLLATGTAMIAALPASAACYADYRAQTTNPTRFHYGVAQISNGACGNTGAAFNELSGRLQQNGWTLVDVLSTFGDEGLGSRQYNAGSYYLRF